MIGQAIGNALAGGLTEGGRAASGGGGRLAIEDAGLIANTMAPEQLTAQLEAIAAQTSVSPVVASAQAPTQGQVAAAVVASTSGGGAVPETDGGVIYVTASRVGADVADVARPRGSIGTWSSALLGIVGTEGDQRSHLLRYYAQSVGGRDLNGNIYAGTDAYQQMNGRRVGKALFDETPVEWGGSSAAIHLLDEMMGLSPEYASALGAARDTYQALREGRNAEVNAQLLQDAQDFGVFYAITGGAVLASGVLAAGIGAAGLTGGGAIAVGAGGEALISMGADSAHRTYYGAEITTNTLLVSGGIGLVTGGIGGRFVGGPRAANAAIPQVTLNKAAGDAFEADVIANVLPKTQVNIRPQITIKSNGPSGLKVRLDAVGDDMATGVVRLSDMKASSTAPFTPNQTTVYPELKLYGGVVAGKGKAPYVGGTNIPPTVVDIIRKASR